MMVMMMMMMMMCLSHHAHHDGHHPSIDLIAIASTMHTAVNRVAMMSAARRLWSFMLEPYWIGCSQKSICTILQSSGMPDFIGLPTCCQGPGWVWQIL
jgi:hypothetical protein